MGNMEKMTKGDNVTCHFQEKLGREGMPSGQQPFFNLLTLNNEHLATLPQVQTFVCILDPVCNGQECKPKIWKTWV